MKLTPGLGLFSKNCFHEVLIFCIQVFTIVNNDEIDSGNETTVLVVSVGQQNETPNDDNITQDDDNVAQEDENSAQVDESFIQDDKNVAQADENITKNDENVNQNDANDAQNVEENTEASKVDRPVVSKEEIFQCSECQKSVQGQMDFFVHLKSHYEPKPVAKKPGPKKATGLSGNLKESERHISYSNHLNTEHLNPGFI